MINREHIFGINLEPSLKFKNAIEDIGDEIFKKKSAREYFGRSPILTPDKNLFILQSEPNTQLIVGNMEVPNMSAINLTLKHLYVSNKVFDEISLLAMDCCDIIKKFLNVKIVRTGSLQNFEIDIKDINSIMINHFVKNILEGYDKYNFSGGTYKYLYRVIENALPEMNINLKVIAEVVDKLRFEIDVNNRNTDIDINTTDIQGIGNYSIEFVEQEFFKFLNSKGIYNYE